MQAIPEFVGRILTLSTAVSGHHHAGRGDPGEAGQPQ